MYIDPCRPRVTPLSTETTDTFWQHLISAASEGKRYTNRFLNLGNLLGVWLCMSLNQCYFDDCLWQLFPSMRLNLSSIVNNKMEFNWEVKKYIYIKKGTMEKLQQEKITRNTFVICCLSVY